MSPPDNRVIATETSRVQLDESAGQRKLELTNKKTGDYLTFDAEANTVGLAETASITIRAVGAITLLAPQTTIGGRLVRPVREPI